MAEDVRIKAVDSGGTSHFALAEDGTVWAWGINRDGQMGISDTGTIYVPFKIPGLTGVKSMATDGQSLVVLKEDGTLWAAGSNSHGQLGDGTMASRSSFGQMKGPDGPFTGAIAVDMDDYVTLVVNYHGLKSVAWMCRLAIRMGG